MKVRYLSLDKAYESHAELTEDTTEPFYWRIYTAIDVHTGQALELILTTTGWEQV